MSLAQRLNANVSSADQGLLQIVETMGNVFRLAYTRMIELVPSGGGIRSVVCAANSVLVPVVRTRLIIVHSLVRQTRGYYLPGNGAGERRQ